jgi:RNA polymerase sigma-70 factor (ECF subfamily)
VLVNPVDADDVVQDAWVRWLQTDRSVVRDPAAFLTTTTTRLALNLGQSARVRHESSVGTWTAEAADPAGNLACRAERREAAEEALWTVLACLSETERAVYILREAFDYPHRRVARLLGLTEANVRQILTRARRRLAQDARGPVDPEQHADLCEVFLAAARTGALAALEALLSGQRAGELAA